MSEEILQFECSVCGDHFDPDPDTMVEMVYSLELMTKREDCVTGKELADLPECDLAAFDLTPEERDIILSGGQVVKGVCVCLECQDEMLEEEI